MPTHAYSTGRGGSLRTVRGLRRHAWLGQGSSLGTRGSTSHHPSVDRRLENGRARSFIIETAATNRQVVGQAGLMIFDTRGWKPSTWANAGTHGQAELGWALIRAHWGHGYATEAAAAIREWARECRSIERLVSLISSDNVRSQRVAERLGAIPTETVTPVHSGRKTVVWRHPPAS